LILKVNEEIETLLTRVFYRLTLI